MISFFLDDQINQFSEHVEDSIGSLKSAEFPKCQPQKFKYPKAKFGSGLERSFNSSWYKLHPWLYYDVKTSAVLYEICVSQGKKGESDPFDQKRGRVNRFSNWKKASEKFRKYQQSNCHRESVSVSSVRETWL